MKLRLAIFFPVLVMLGWAVSQEWRLRAGEPVNIAITGFDPRDLLAGHYLTYQLDLGRDVCHGRWGKITCVCLEGDPAKAGFAGDCSQRGDCRP